MRQSIKFIFKVMEQNKFYAAIIAAGIVILDIATKLLIQNVMAENHSIPLIRNILHFTFITNTGTLFGLFQNANLFFILISAAVIGFLGYYLATNNIEDKLSAIGFGLVTGGAIGNLIDRIVYGHVIDFIDVRVWPVFNIADSAITIGVVLLILKMVKE